VNGIGERAGNASLEEVVMAIKTRSDFFHLGTNIDTTQIHRTSRLVAQLTGMSVQPNKAIVGANSFRHQSGIHQHGVTKMRQTYEIMDPKDIGHPRGTVLVLNKNSQTRPKARLDDWAWVTSRTDQFFTPSKTSLTRRAIDDRTSMPAPASGGPWRTSMLDLLQVPAKPPDPHGHVRIIGPNGAMAETTATGTGPVDAAYKALNELIGVKNRLLEYAINSVTEGIDAQGEVTVRIEADERTFVGRAADTDVIVASAKALLNAINRAIAHAPGEREAVTANP
jgi:2-isopropylmalate synthase